MIQPFKPIKAGDALEPKRKRFQKLKPAKPPVQQEAAYKRQLLALTSMVQKAVEDFIIPIFNIKVADSIVTDQNDDDEILDAFTNAMRSLKDQFALMAPDYRTAASEFSSGVENETKKRFNNMLARATGGQPSISSIIAEEGLGAIVRAETEKNVDLISSVPQNYLKAVQDLVTQNFITGSKTEGGLQADILTKLRKDIRAIGPKAKRRAKLIARDQTSKLNAVLTKVRQTNLGIEEYIWSNSQDSRVRGNPGGLYPNVPATRNHWIREGKVFRWDSPPPDGHPGEPINCRCVAIPVIKKPDVETKEIEEEFAELEEDIYTKEERALIKMLEEGKISTPEFNKRMGELD